MTLNLLFRSGLSLLLITPLLACGPHSDGSSESVESAVQVNGAGDITDPETSGSVDDIQEASEAPQSSGVISQQNHAEVPAAQDVTTKPDSTPARTEEAAAEQQEEGVVVAEATTDTPAEQYQPLEEIREIQTGRKPLDLSLPSMDWADDDNRDFNSTRQSLPDVFRYQKPENGMNLSGKLHWDEDEETTNMSLEESIKGAEVELQFRLP